MICKNCNESIEEKDFCICPFCDSKLPMISQQKVKEAIEELRNETTFDYESAEWFEKNLVKKLNLGEKNSSSKEMPNMQRQIG